MPRLSKIGAAALAAFGWTSGVSAVSASYLVVAGGGGGGSGESARAGGGGGAGGLLSGTTTLNPTLSYTVTVGAGGTGAVNITSNSNTNGSNSVFNAITSTGGGAGGTTGTNAGQNGGSGGGGCAGSAAGTGVSGQGFAGGVGQAAANSHGGGGGGASAVGTSGSSGVGGTGGDGTASSITGSSVTYAGGGGGGLEASGTQGVGGAGGGGTGNNGAGTNGTSGTANLGGGGGGAGKGTGGASITAGNGGSGIVIISYAGAQQFGGGVVTSVGGNTIHTFTTSGTLVPVTPLTANFLVIAGGGGGGSDVAGGGGAGGYRTSAGTSGGGAPAESTLTIDTNSIYLVTVGAGGAGTPSGGRTRPNGTNGSNSVFSSITSTGGGGGGSYTGSSSGGGNSGGSGGGGAGAESGQTSTGGAGTANQGFAGGNGTTQGVTSGYNGGGGGGAGGAGTAGAGPAPGTGGNGGAGVASTITGSSVTYAGGGGGCSNTGTAGTASGGGGAGAAGAANGTSGTANTGGGGGGAGTSGTTGQVGGNGGSGIVIISYPGSTQQMAGGTVTITGGNVIHTFTSSGYLTPLKLVNNSLRFRSSASGYLTRTPSVASNRTTWTWSAWVKRGSLTSTFYFFGARQLSTSTPYSLVYFASSDQLTYVDDAGTTLQTSQVFRDPAAWYHIVISVDTTQATAANRYKMFVNGNQVTAFGTATYAAQNSNTGVNAAILHQIGIATNGAGAYVSPLDGYMTEINLIDGQALTPNSFGTFNSYGVWQPITYGGSYGTNGFYLPFTNKTSTTTLGYDFSPNGNNWTPSAGISLTAGATYDSMTDVPTLTSATAANYAVLNPLSTLYTVTAGNLDFTYTNSTSGVWYLKGTLAVSSDKYYWEVTPTNVGAGLNISIGIILSTNTQTNTTTINLVTDGYVYHSDGNKYSGAGGTTGVAYGATYTNNDVIGVALDLTAGTLVFYKNNVSQGTAFTGLTSSYMLLICSHLGGTSRTVAGSVNAGQRPFTYTPPTGFVALNTYNL